MAMADDCRKTRPARVLSRPSPAARGRGTTPQAWWRGKRRRLAILLAACALAACGRPPASSAAGSAAGSAAAPPIGGPFRLIDQDGRPRDQRLLQGKWSAVYFGYTFCPDVCPTTLTALAAAERLLPTPEAARLQTVFVTVDPARDTPAVLKTYLSEPDFPKGAIGLTGPPAAIAKVAHEYGVYFRQEGTGPGYSVDHTSVVYLMNSQGQFDRPLDTTQPPAAVARQLEQALGS